MEEFSLLLAALPERVSKMAVEQCDTPRKCLPLRDLPYRYEKVASALLMQRYILEHYPQQLPDPLDIQVLKQGLRDLSNVAEKLDAFADYAGAKLFEPPTAEACDHGERSAAEALQLHILSGTQKKMMHHIAESIRMQAAAFASALGVPSSGSEIKPLPNGNVTLSHKEVEGGARAPKPWAEAVRKSGLRLQGPMSYIRDDKQHPDAISF